MFVCAPTKIVVAAAYLLDACINKTLEVKYCPFNSWSTRSPMRLIEYISYWTYYANANDDVVIYAIILVDRLCTYSSIVITSSNIHYLVGIALLIATKIQDDFSLGMSYYAKIINTSLRKLCYLEKVFIHYINWDFIVTSDNYNDYYVQLLAIEQS